MTEDHISELHRATLHWSRLLHLADSRDLAGLEAEGFGSDNCALCQTRKNGDEIRCDGFDAVPPCPVYLKTGEWGCQNTPYTDVVTWINLFAKHPEQGLTLWPKLRQSILTEYYFIKHLLDKRQPVAAASVEEEAWINAVDRVADVVRVAETH